MEEISGDPGSIISTGDGGRRIPRRVTTSGSRVLSKWPERHRVSGINSADRTTRRLGLYSAGGNRSSKRADYPRGGPHLFRDLDLFRASAHQSGAAGGT